MTPLEYVETYCVCKALLRACERTAAAALPDGRNGMRYLYELGTALDEMGLDGVRFDYGERSQLPVRT